MDPKACDPQDLKDRDPRGIGEAGGPPLRIALRRPKPEPDHADTHDHVARDRNDALAVVEHVRDSGGHHEDADHDHEGEQAEDDVIVVVGGGVPGVVHPRPPDDGEGHGETERIAEVTFGKAVMQLDADGRDRDDEGEVEEELEGGGDAAALVRIAGADRAQHRSGVGLTHRPIIGPALGQPHGHVCLAT